MNRSNESPSVRGEINMHYDSGDTVVIVGKQFGLPDMSTELEHSKMMSGMTNSLFL